MHSTPFEAFIAPARARPAIWRVLIGVLLIVALSVGVFVALIGAVYLAVGPAGFQDWMIGLERVSTPAPSLVLLLSFVGPLLGTLLAARLLHKRSPGTLFGPRTATIRAFVRGIAVLVPVYGAVLLVAALFFPDVPNMPLEKWLRLLPLALVLLLVQISAEELVFRGYLQQQLAARFGARWVWMGLPSAGFAALHWDPAAESNLWLILLVIFCFALIAADLTERSGNLGTALALHFVNNISALLIVAVDGSITGLALFVTPYQINDTTTLRWLFGLDLALLFAVWRLLRAVILR